MAIPTPPAAPNPLGTNFAAEALAFTQWMHTAAPEFNTAVTDANAAVGDAEQAVVDAAAQVTLATTQASNAGTSASTASGHATAADTARANAVIAKDAAEDARDMSQTYAALAGAAAGLPALAGQALKALRVNGAESGVEWTDQFPVASITRALKTSAYTLAGADKGALIDCSGTWTLGLTAAATLGSGWWCYVRNIGTGTITANPNASELIDGVTSGAIRPGMTLLVQCDGTAFHCVRVGPHVAMEVLTSGTSWTAPLGVRAAKFRLTNGGADGNAGNGSIPGSGGAGGSVAEFISAISPGTAYAYAVGAAAGTTQITIAGDVFTGGNIPAGRVGKIIASGPYSDGLSDNGLLGATTPTGFGRGGNGGLSAGSAGSPGGIILEY